MYAFFCRGAISSRGEDRGASSGAATTDVAGVTEEVKGVTAEVATIGVGVTGEGRVEIIEVVRTGVVVATTDVVVVTDVTTGTTEEVVVVVVVIAGVVVATEGEVGRGT
jgi:hypothetical protein